MAIQVTSRYRYEKMKAQDYVLEYQRMLSVYAKMAAEHPELIDAYREALKTSSTLMLSNCPELINEFRRLAGDLDAFLMACKTGEIVPQDFIKKTTHPEEK